MTTPSVGVPTPPPARRRRRRFTPLAMVTGLVSAVILALSMNSSLAAFTASITNSVNTVSTGTLTMLETGPGGAPTCSSTSGTNNAFTCTTINKYGGTATPLAPGTSVTTTITIKNTGTLPATTFTLTPDLCVQSGTGTANDFCSRVGIVVTANGTTITPTGSTLASIGTNPATPINIPAPIAPVAPGAVVTFAFTVSLPASLGNTYQNLTASQPLTFTFTS